MPNLFQTPLTTYDEYVYKIRDSYTLKIPDSILSRCVGLDIGIEIVSGVNLSFNYKSIPPASFYGYATPILEDLPIDIIPIRLSPMWLYRWTINQSVTTVDIWSSVQVHLAHFIQLMQLLPSHEIWNLRPLLPKCPIREIHIELLPLTEANIRIGVEKFPPTLTGTDGIVIPVQTRDNPSGKPDRRNPNNKYDTPENRQGNNPFGNNNNNPFPTGSDFDNPSQLGDSSSNVEPPRGSIGVGDSVSVGPNGGLLVNGQPANGTLTTDIASQPYRLIKVTYQRRENNANFGGRSESYFESTRFPNSFSFPNPNGMCENAYQIHYISPYNGQNMVLESGCSTDFRIEG